MSRCNTAKMMSDITFNKSTKHEGTYLCLSLYLIRTSSCKSRSSLSRDFIQIYDLDQHLQFGWAYKQMLYWYMYKKM